MHALDALESNVQQLHQFDWSSGHAKSREGGLLIANMNMNYGGARGKKLRDSVLTEDDVGDAEAFMFEATDKEGKVSFYLKEPSNPDDHAKLTKHDCRVYPGMTQEFSFSDKENNPLPPFNRLDAKYEDSPDLDKKGKQKVTKKGNKKVIKGHAGVAKGMAQILWERGLCKPKMKLHLDSEHEDYPDLCASTTLENCADFREETGAMETLILSQGHLCLFSSKGHPEIAGAGIEYDWGVSKKSYRKENNHIAKFCERDVRPSLKNIDLPMAYNTSRRARSYMAAYLDDCSESQLLIEKFVKIHKCHRNILDQETKYLEDLRVKIEEHSEDIKNEKISIKQEKDSQVKVEIDEEKIDKELVKKLETKDQLEIEVNLFEYDENHHNLI